MPSRTVGQTRPGFFSGQTCSHTAPLPQMVISMLVAPVLVTPISLRREPQSRGLHVTVGEGRDIL